MSVCVTMRPVCIQFLYFFFSNVMPNTHTPHKPLNYVLDDLPPSPAARPILGQQHCRERGRKGQKRVEKRGMTEDRNEEREEGIWER